MREEKLLSFTFLLIKSELKTKDKNQERLNERKKVVIVKSPRERAPVQKFSSTVNRCHIP